jgi:hypothetical protein
MNAEKTEHLMREMRERALLLQGDPNLKPVDLTGWKLKQEKQRKLEQLEALKKLYFNAGRWAGGARDHVAREAFHAYNQRENR